MGDMADWVLDQIDWDEEWVSVNEPDRTFPVIVVGHTGKAWLCRLRNHKETWFPKSYCSIKDGKITVPGWLMRKKLDEGDI